MRANHDPEPLVVVRSEAAPGRVGLRLIGELDLNTVPLLEAELSRTREPSAPSVIDLSELRFLDLTGLRVLLRAVEGVAGTRLVGATGIVRRLIDLAHTLEFTTTADAPSRPPFPAELTTRIHARDEGARATFGIAPAAAHGEALSAFSENDGGAR